MRCVVQSSVLLSQNCIICLSSIFIQFFRLKVIVLFLANESKIESKIVQGAFNVVSSAFYAGHLAVNRVPTVLSVNTGKDCINDIIYRIHFASQAWEVGHLTIDIAYFNSNAVLL